LKQPSIRQLGISTAALLALEEITIISGTKTQLSSSRGATKVLYNTQTVEGIAMKMIKNFTDSEKQI
jgi:hypothetical protein